MGFRVKSVSEDRAIYLQAFFREQLLHHDVARFSTKVPTVEIFHPIRIPPDVKPLFHGGFCVCSPGFHPPCETFFGGDEDSI